MHISTVFVFAAAAQLVTAAPFSYPLSNGFPNPNPEALQEVFKLAGGTFPQDGSPADIAPDSVQALQLIAANELFEVAFFSDLLKNITNKVSGYDKCEPYVVDALTAVLNQEQVHALSANNLLKQFKKEVIQPCKYTFPTSNIDDAIVLAQTFTDLVLGVLPVAQTVFANAKDDETILIQTLGYIIGQEGEQNGWYRFLQKKVPSAAPFLTGNAPQFAFTALSQFIVPGSCPNLNVLGIKAFPGLTIESTPKAANSTQLFSVEGKLDDKNSSLVFMSGQTAPVTVPISNLNEEGGKTYFFAPFPWEGSAGGFGFARGLTLATLVSGSKNDFANVSEVATATTHGPALIEID